MADFAFLPYGSTQTELSLGYVDYILSVQNYMRSHPWKYSHIFLNYKFLRKGKETELANYMAVNQKWSLKYGMLDISIWCGFLCRLRLTFKYKDISA